MSERPRNRTMVVVATVAGSVAGALIAFGVTDRIVGGIGDSTASVVGMLAGWVVLSVTAGLAAYVATAPFSRHALSIALSVFVWVGLLVYPGILLYAVFEMPVEALVVGGASLAGLGSALLVARIEPA